jgi:hypothetical protein
LPITLGINEWTDEFEADIGFVPYSGIGILSVFSAWPLVIDIHLAKHNLGAFFAPQKTGLSGGSAACAAAPRPSRSKSATPLGAICDPLRGCGVRPASTA